jgi:hypothetical protein
MNTPAISASEQHARTAPTAERRSLCFLNDLDELHRAWRQHWKTSLKMQLGGTFLPRTAEADILLALHAPESRVPETEKVIWGNLQQQTHQLLHRLHAIENDTSKNCRSAILRECIDAASTFEQILLDILLRVSQDFSETDALTGLPKPAAHGT